MSERTGSGTKGVRTGAIVLAGGKGRRMNRGIQKQYLMLAGKPLIAYSLEAFEHSPADEIVLVTGAGEREYVSRNILAPGGFQKVSKVVEGGKERYHSVYAGLQALQGCDYVLIHDGARPLVSREIICRAVQGAMDYRACVAAMPVKDTIKEADKAGTAIRTLDRDRLWQIQTPQAFAYSLIREAYDWLMEKESRQLGITDDAMVLESYGGPPVRLVEGSYTNLKVTTPEDMLVAEVLLEKKSL